MSHEAEVRYPQSASLFQFCRRVLDHKFGGVRVIDQDVGQILKFDPADCSHWKKGKKNIRSIQAMKAISEHLGVDERLVVDVASGEMKDDEAYFEFIGYGRLVVDPDVLEKARKEFYLKNANTWTREKEHQFKEFFNICEHKIDKIVEEIHTKVDFNEAPLYLPEIAAVYPDIQLRPNDGKSLAIVAKEEQDKTLVFFPAHEKMRPYMRYQIAKAMAEYFFKAIDLPSPKELGTYADDVREVQSNLFATKLLAPARLIRKELSTIQVNRDLVTQLADAFWVSKGFMNLRLKDIIQNS